MVEELMLPELTKQVDHDFLMSEIIPRISVCSISDLVHSVSRIKPAQFNESARKAFARPGRLAVRDTFQEDCARPTDQRQAQWLLPLATSAFGGCSRRQNLTLAHAQRPARLTGAGAHYSPGLIERHHFLTCCDKLASAKGGPGACRMLVPLAFDVHGPEHDTRHTPYPLVDVLLDLAQHVLTQPTRLFAPGLAILDDADYFTVLDHEGCRIATISDCWCEGYGELASVLSILLGLDVYSAGLSPLFRYACHSETGIAPDAFCTRYLRLSEPEADAPLVGRTVEFVHEEPIKLVQSAVVNGSSLFSHCTVVFQLTRESLVTKSPSSSEDDPKPSFVLKIQHVSPKFVGHEAEVLNAIVKRCASAGSSTSSRLLESHVVLPEKAKSLSRHRSQMKESDLPVLINREDPKQREQYSSRRTLDVIILRNPTRFPIPVDDGRGPEHPLSQALKVFDQLLTLLPVLFNLGIHHRDLSLGNILHYQGYLVLVDWGTGIVAPRGERVPVAAQDTSSFRITRATAPFQAQSHTWTWLNAVNAVNKIPFHGLRHDFESSVHWFLLVLDSFIGDVVSADI
ncbi:hypothetical protein MVLG_02312 [Microbotryum lychnidis-dioicae p1A1 Lamole]|uniref:Fungal-type protein kinase domain-containing protein n=1 Tax=Microbotryum lychnidis-dioicae (strain p1A1 Lamole / MvSl-1064) TaxID=683840 RepID=U5H4S6_USTV1|nr:hypothetical protein MVLG_02312 [Microbotryum lychnidis-dioicae p1A1 Lamole]|eukprot:KDE07447.1 hypothetical protein MVLG_02312 [Microbotryum lychnidis-dioicae p1A1 Lamole]